MPAFTAERQQEGKKNFGTEFIVPVEAAIAK